MKFFTLANYGHPDPDGKLFAAQQAAYTRHLEELRGIMPDELLALAVLPGVDDGLIVEVRHDRSQRMLRLTLRCGDTPGGYYDLQLDYDDIDLSAEAAWALAQIARTTKDKGRHRHDVAFHEVDRTADGGVEHRLLFHPGVVVQLCCHTLHWRKIPRPDRRLPFVPDRFPEGPIWAAYHTHRRRLRAAPSRR